MGVYNPHLPRILGQEWIPIRDELLTLTPAVNAVEVGHQFTTTASQVLQDARFYINELPPSTAAGQVFLATIYPQGTEHLSGPVRRVVIPCNNGGVTGDAVLLQPAGPVSVAQAMADPSDQSCIEFGFGTSVVSNLVDLYFNVNRYIGELQGKRILGVNLLYSLLNYKSVPQGIGGPYVVLGGNTGDEVWFGGFDGTIDNWGNDTSFSPTSTNISQTGALGRVQFGEVDHFWSGTGAFSTTERLPWTVANLQRFEASATNRHAVRIRHNQNGPVGSVFSLRLNYAALEIVYCEENRVSYGGTIFGDDGVAVPGARLYAPGANVIRMRDKSLAANPTLAAGNYTLALSSANVGHLVNFALLAQSVQSTAYPKLNAVRELATLTGHRGVRINLPFPATDAIVGKTFSAETTHILPQLSLHASGGPLTEVHVYGRQAVAQVYGTATALQEILDAPVGGAATFPQARFYARRFGDTTVPLTLDCAAIPASSASITPADFDALADVIDGWKEITLAFPTPPSMGTGTTPQWRFSANGETIANRWEILGATAPALSGVPGNTLNLVPSPHQLSIATYGAPVSGATVNLSWIPQYAPAVTAVTDDQTSDAYLIFSQLLPAVTGLSVAVAAQPVSGIGQQCGVNPCGIPTSISYHQITWSATSSSVPVSGFGYYELQRMDIIDTDWATIAKVLSPTGSAFRDYEARIGIPTSYRIRPIDVYLFAGDWSATVSQTIPAPGIGSTGGCVTGGHSLIFTSNERQDGSINLAYSTVWEGTGAVAEEAFSFVESNAVQLQAMYNRDDLTAFRPLEMAGDAFSRTLLINAAAISPPTLPGFASLRSMAWDTVSYICVRDEEGNRWFATVIVPSGRVKRDRRMYLAQVNITEVSSVPSQVSA